LISADDTVDGYLIPKNTIVILNIWGLNHTPVSASTSSPTSNKEFPLSEFDPDRFATRTNLSPFYAASSDFAARDHYTYGAGRRICPGIHLAERTMCIAIAKLLWAFEFKEKPGKPVDVDPRTGYTEGVVKAPVPFECEVLVRRGREGFIEREFKEVGGVLRGFEG
jgi:cytochrome P450